MEITVTKEALNRALSLMQSVVAKKTTMPILSNVLLSATDGSVNVSATDLEITAVIRLEAKVKSKGSTTVNAKVLADIVRELPEGDITLKLTEGERLEIVCKKAKLRMIGISAEEYPSLPGVVLEPRSKISSKQLLDMINKTLYAVSVDETRFNLNGVCFEILNSSKGKKGDASLQLVATDGHRLAMITRPAGTLDFQGRAIAPRKGLAEIKKIINPEEDVEIGLDIQEGFLVVESNDTKLSMRLVDGEFPNYEDVVPKKKGQIIKVNSEELAQALRRSALMVSDRGKCVKLEFGKNKLKISSSSPELGDAVEEIECHNEKDALSVGFNALYLLDFVSSVSEAQSVVLELNGELGAGRFYADKDESYNAIVMPMRLN